MTSTPSPLDRLRLYQDILNSFSRIATEAMDLNRLFHLACAQAARGTGIKHTKVLRYRPDRGDMLVEAGVGWKPGVVGHTTLGTDIASPPGRALQSRATVCIEDLPNDGSFRCAPMLREHGIVSLLNAPIAVDGAVWGVLEVDSDTPRHFSHDDTAFLSAMANILALAIREKQMEARAADADAKAARELAQCRVLMRELVHRDKNDFQLIMSILLMQENRQRDDQARLAFRQVMDRVAAVSVAHDQLATRRDYARIDLANYLQALCGALEHRSEHVRIDARFDSVEVTHERAVSLGLITNELVTNALKYAFPNGQGTVRVEVRVDPEDQQGCLTVADDGVGMGSPQAGSSGLMLVDALAAQIGGSVERSTRPPGTTFHICFPLVL